MLTTFTLTVFVLIFFRAENISHAFDYVSEIFSESLLKVPHFNNGTNSIPTIIFTIVFVLIEWIGRKDKFAIESIFLKQKRPLRYFLYCIIFFSILFWYGGKEQQFIYFQF